MSQHAEQLQCGCKGIRSCLVCEKERKINLSIDKCSRKIHYFCDLCNKAFEESKREDHPNHQGKSLEFPGIFIQRDFLSPEEEWDILKHIYQSPFVESQSGRRKQDYGPKVNFKRKKVKSELFTGLPNFSKPLYERMTLIEILKDFKPVEQCNLEYVPERGASIDPHYDDFWLWGERLVTLNLGSDTILCMTSSECPDVSVHVPMCRRSLIVVYGPARHKWMHGIHRCDITDRRIAITFRELSAEFQPGGEKEEVGQNLLDIALTFEGVSVGSMKEL
ncbi:alpha-ketoglutarate-dependent dioxygenase alkB homolog 4-like [Saccostrea cucullata]|uniref:alpha-ketoglutarate-dependent dioxygenase alkB homolog 4-like n=1 Tax=Saccostrea cuccullata TaxID=36930 RepID=UPI002ED29649